MSFKTILPGAWELTEDVECQLFPLYVPTSWQQVAKSLTQKRAELQGQRYRGVPVYSLDPLIAGIFPPIIQTVRNGWQKSGVPWLFATEQSSDLYHLPWVVKDWLREEFSWCLENDEVESSLEKLNDCDWQWEEGKTYSLLHKPDSSSALDARFQALPDYLAREFLKNSTVAFGENEQYQLTFYRVVRLKGAELMSWPPHPVSLKDSKGNEKGKAFISFAIRFVLQTVPWRKNPIIYPQLSIHRWFAEPLERVPYRGATVYVGDRRRWLDGKEQPLCFIPLTVKSQNGEVKWPRAIKELLAIHDSQLPEPNHLISNPTANWRAIAAIPTELQAAIAYDTRHRGDPPCLPGVSPLDLYSLDRAIQDRVAETLLQRVGKAEKVSGTAEHLWPVNKPKKTAVVLAGGDLRQSTKRKKPEEKAPDELSTPMLRPKIAARAVFRETENPLRTVLILWETPRCRDELVAELCLLLSLSPTGEPTIYKGPYGSLCIKTQHVGDLTQNFDFGEGYVSPKTRQKRRVDFLEERIQSIKSFLPPTEGVSGALIEIKRKPSIPEADPKLAWRIAAMDAGYVNQHIHRITYITEEGKEKIKKSALEPVKRAVSDLLRQCGILPIPLIKPEIDGIDPRMWLTCFWVGRRTRKTTASNTPNTAVLMVRVNPVTGKVELTTPSLFPEWEFYPFGLQHLLREKWHPDSYVWETTEDADAELQQLEQKREQKLINQFVADCLRDCLNTAIDGEESPKVLFMAEAQNARLKLPWLQNPHLSDALKQLGIRKPGEIDRLWIVRLRLANNGEVPEAIVKNSPGSRASGVFRWKGACDKPDEALYLSLRKPLNTEKGTKILQQKHSRLDDGSRLAGKARLLEIAIAHCREIDPDKLAHFVHRLRSRWPYFANDVNLPLPFPLATKTKEYAVSARDPVEVSEEDDSEELE